MHEQPTDRLRHTASNPTFGKVCHERARISCRLGRLGGYRGDSDWTALSRAASAIQRPVAERPTLGGRVGIRRDGLRRPGNRLLRGAMERRPTCLATARGGRCRRAIGRGGAFCSIGSAGAGIAANGLVYRIIAQSSGTYDDFVSLVASVVVEITWHTYLVFWTMTATVTALSALDDWAAAARPSDTEQTGDGPSRPRQDMSGMSGGFAAVSIGVTMVVFSSVNFWLAVRVYAEIAQRTNEWLEPAAPYSTLLAHGVVDWPATCNLLVLSAAVWWCWRIIAGRWRNPTPKTRRMVAILAVVSLFVSLIVIWSAPVSHPKIFRHAALLGGLGVLSLAFAMSFYRVRRTPQLAAPSVANTGGDSDLVVQSFVVGVLITAAFIIGGGSTVGSLHYGLISVWTYWSRGRPKAASPRRWPHRWATSFSFTCC